MVNPEPTGNSPSQVITPIAAEFYDCEGNCTVGTDCTDTCGGTAAIDECGVCEGDGSSCVLNIDFSLGDAVNGGVDVFMANTHPVLGFQFDISGMSFSAGEGSGGSAEANGFTVSTGPNGVLGISVGGSAIPIGDGLLTSLVGEFDDFEACITDVILSIDGEGFQTITEGDCVATDAVADCAGVANGDAVEDECGVCDGPGLNVDGCCAELTPDCAGECGGNAIEITVCLDSDGDGMGDPSTETTECVGGDTTINGGCDLPDMNLYVTESGSVYFNSSQDIGGFQFTVEGTTVTEGAGGEAAAAGFMVSASSTTVLGFSLTGAVIPAGCGTLLELTVDGVATGLSDLTISDAILCTFCSRFNTFITVIYYPCTVTDSITIYCV